MLHTNEGGRFHNLPAQEPMYTEQLDNHNVNWSNTKSDYSLSRSQSKKRRKSVFKDPHSPLNQHIQISNIDSFAVLDYQQADKTTKNRSISPVPRIPLEKIQNLRNDNKVVNQNYISAPKYSAKEEHINDKRKMLFLDESMATSGVLSKDEEVNLKSSRFKNKVNNILQPQQTKNNPMNNSMDTQSLMSNSMTLAEVNSQRIIDIQQNNNKSVNNYLDFTNYQNKTKNNSNNNVDVDECDVSSPSLTLRSTRIDIQEMRGGLSDTFDYASFNANKNDHNRNSFGKDGYMTQQQAREQFHNRLASREPQSNSVGVKNRDEESREKRSGSKRNNTDHSSRKKSRRDPSARSARKRDKDGESRNNHKSKSREKPSNYLEVENKMISNPNRLSKGKQCFNFSNQTFKADSQNSLKSNFNLKQDENNSLQFKNAQKIDQKIAKKQTANEVFYESCESNHLDDILVKRVSTGLETVREAIEHELEMERNTQRSDRNSLGVAMDYTNAQSLHSNSISLQSKQMEKLQIDNQEMFRRKVPLSQNASKDTSLSPSGLSPDSVDASRRGRGRNEIGMEEFLQNKIASDMEKLSYNTKSKVDKIEESKVDELNFTQESKVLGVNNIFARSPHSKNNVAIMDSNETSLKSKHD